jgi:hypothetical protein
LLLQDIEDQGGLHEAFKLKTLRAGRPEVYGLPGNAMRRAIQNKTQRLKKLNRVAYMELLVSVGIEAFSHQRHRGIQRMQLPQQGSGISPAQLTILLYDIESHGGLNGVVGLRTICNLKPDVYGLPGTKERRVIQNKMHHLKFLSRVEYLQMLSAMGIHRSSP